MKHIILDENVIYSEKFRNYYFKFNNGRRSSYFRIIDEKVNVGPDNLIEKDTFRVIQSKKTGYHMIVSAHDTSQKCLLFIGFSSFPHEIIEIDEEYTNCDIIERYSDQGANDSECLKMIVVLSPRKPLVIKYRNKLTGIERYEFVAYDAILETIDRKTITGKERSALYRDVEIFHDSEYDYSQFRVTKEMLMKMTPEKIAEAEEYAKKYWSPIKDA